MHIQSATMNQPTMDARSSMVATLPADSLWAEHGWGLSGRHVAMLVGVVLIASMVLRVLGQ